MLQDFCNMGLKLEVIDITNFCDFKADISTRESESNSHHHLIILRNISYFQNLSAQISASMSFYPALTLRKF
jgi:hypothetical protein